MMKQWMAVKSSIASFYMEQKVCVQLGENI